MFEAAAGDLDSVEVSAWRGSGVDGIGDSSCVLGRSLGDSYETKTRCCCLKYFAEDVYCAFQKHTNSEVQNPTYDCVFRCRQS